LLEDKKMKETYGCSLMRAQFLIGRAISKSVASALLLCVDFVERYIRFRENI